MAMSDTLLLSRLDLGPCGKVDEAGTLAAKIEETAYYKHNVWHIVSNNYKNW